MVGCSAPNCNGKGNRKFRFPTDPERRKKWLVNCKWDNLTPSDHSRICEAHFEQSQFELHRLDGRKLLKSSAVPTLFNIPNPPKRLDSTRRSRNKFTLTNSITGERQDSSQAIAQDPLQVSVPSINEPLEETNSITGKRRKKSQADAQDPLEQLASSFSSLQKENEKLKTELIKSKYEIKIWKDKYEDLHKSLEKFLSPEQIKHLTIPPSTIHNWSNESILKGIQYRYALGANGYKFLRCTGYPLPSTSTLNKRFHQLNMLKVDSIFKTKYQQLMEDNKINCDHLEFQEQFKICADDASVVDENVNEGDSISLSELDNGEI